MPTRCASTQVIIVGAGYAGLAAARELTAKGVDVIVVEARERVAAEVMEVLD